MSAPDAPAAAELFDSVEWLFALQRFGMEPGLARVHALLAACGSPQRTFEAVLVAGTNGKGSTSGVLAACLQAGGRRTGLFISPHLQRIGERAVVDGVESTMEAFADATAFVRPHAERLGATFFEVVTVVCAVLFQRARVRVAVMEVGMGGRLDATNALEPMLSIITGVALDHMAVLGDDVATIAGEKAGILRSGLPALTAATGTALGVIEDEARRLGAELTVLGRDLHAEVNESTWDGLKLTITGLVDDPEAPLAVVTALAGRHQASNVALAVAGAVKLGVPRNAVVSGVAKCRWHGRLERLSYQGRHVVFDGAHNAQGAEALAAAMAELAPDCEVMLLGTSADKDHAGLVLPLVNIAEHVIATRAVFSPRATEPERLARYVTEVAEAAGAMDARGRVSSAATPVEALTSALDIAPVGGYILVAGSLFLVGEVRSIVLGTPTEHGERWQ